MIVFLTNQLRHLLFGVGVEGRRFSDVIDDGNFSPKYDAILIRKLISLFIVFVMGQPQSRGAHLLEHRKICGPLSAPDCPAMIQPVLMHAHAVQIIVATIEKKAVRRIHVEPAEAQRLGDHVGEICAAINFGERLVEVGIRKSIP